MATWASSVRTEYYRAARFAPFRQGMRDMKWAYGGGSRGLFHRSTLKAGKLGIAGRLLGPALTGAMMYQGYKEGGVMGALKEGAMMGATSFAWGAGMKAAGAVLGGAAPFVAVAAVGAAVGYGTYKALEHGNQKMKRMRRLEMGSPVVDPFGIGATMRQRSLSALMQSQINGRSAIGQEAALMHMPVMR